MADLTFRFGSSGADRLKGDMRAVSDNSVLAARGARLLSDALEKQRRAAGVSAGATIALARADSILADAEEELSGRAALADAALRGQGDAARKAGRDAAVARAGFTGLAGAGGIPGGGLGAVIAAGVVLSPVIATLAVGMGGLGLAAIGVAKNQKLMATELAPLKAEYSAFQKSLQPEVLKLFGTGIKIAGGLLHDVAPIAQATGKAFDTLLGRVGAEFRSGEWQGFFQFMERSAGPDIKLLGDNFISLMRVLPGLLEALQPVASALLQVTNAGLGAIGMVEALVKKTRQAGGGQPTIWDEIKGGIGWVEQHAPAGNKSIGQLVEGWLGMTSAADAAGAAAAGAGAAFAVTWPKAQTLAQQVQAAAAATTNLMNAQNTALSTQLAYGNSLVTTANDASSLKAALKLSGGAIGLQTQAQRNSFAAANTYIGDLASQASNAYKSGHGTDAAIAAIRGGLPALDSAKTKNHEYWVEVKQLRNWLKALQLVAFENIKVHVTGSGTWTAYNIPGVAHGPQNIGAAPGGFAAGGRVPFSTGTPGKDSVLVMTKPGEIFIPPEKGPMLAPALHAAGIPGFAKGGIAGWYNDGPGGLGPWTGKWDAAMLTDIAVGASRRIAAAVKAAVAAAQAASGGMGDSGARSGSAALAQAFAKSIMGQYHWGPEQWPPWLYLGNQESGWNAYAVNKSSGAYGIGQSLGHGHPYNLGDYKTQVIWMANYIRGRYGNPARAWAHERAYNWYGKGGIVPGFASGGVAGQGAAWLKAWQTRHGGGFGAAWGPVVVNEQIARMKAAIGRAKSLSGAGGLSAGQHKFWAAAAADETKRLGVLGRELTTERAWRYQLGLGELALDKEIRAAGNIPSLAGPVKGWKAALGRDRATVAAISKMLGYSDAYLAAHKPAPAGVLATHSYGGDIVNSIAPVLAAALGPFTGAARGGMVFDRGGTLRPGWNPVYNGTGRPESLVPARGGGGATDVHVHFHGPVGSQAELERWLTTALRKGTATMGGGSVQRAYGRR